MCLKTKPFLLTLLIIINFTVISNCQALLIVNSIKPFYNITAFLTQNVKVDNKLLVTNNASPHDFNLKPSDLINLHQADLIIWGGPELEIFLIKILKDKYYTNKLLQLDKTLNLKLISLNEEHSTCHGHEHHGSLDPHFWLDPNNAQLTADTIANRLIKLDANNVKQYTKNINDFKTKIKELDLDLKHKLEPIQQQPFMVFHDGYQYFTKHFKLNSVGAITINPNLPASAKRVATLQHEMKHHKAICIFSEPQFQPKIVNTLIAGTNIKTGELDPLGKDADLGPNGYFLLLEDLSTSLLNCLN